MQKLFVSVGGFQTRPQKKMLSKSVRDAVKFTIVIHGGG